MGSVSQKSSRVVYQKKVSHGCEAAKRYKKDDSRLDARNEIVEENKHPVKTIANESIEYSKHEKIPEDGDKFEIYLVSRKPKKLPV